MSIQPNGELVPVGGGDAIPLIRPVLTLGRRDSCDIPLHFPNVSGLHCELAFKEGCWILRDLNSTNGVKVNGIRVARKALQPSDTITIAKRSYQIQYQADPNSQAFKEETEDISQVSLMEKAGLTKRPSSPSKMNYDEFEE